MGLKPVFAVESKMPMKHAVKGLADGGYVRLMLWGFSCGIFLLFIGLHGNLPLPAPKELTQRIQNRNLSPLQLIRFLLGSILHL